MKNPYAFPSTDEQYYDEVKIDSKHFPGMTLRDWFAGQVLVGFMADPAVDICEGLADSCYRMADHMINSSNKETNE